LVFRGRTATNCADREVGVVKFQMDDKDMEGNNKETTSIKLNNTVDFGDIAISSDGEVVIPVSQISKLCR
jgi:hypothetical protein